VLTPGLNSTYRANGRLSKRVPHNKLNREVKSVFPLRGYKFKIDVLPKVHNVLDKNKGEIGLNELGRM
jgi:hypothetical protein